MRVRHLLAALVVLAVVELPAASAAAAIRIDRIQYDPAGTDTRTNAHLNQEWVIIENTGNRRVNIGEWVLRDAAGHHYTFGDVNIRAGGSVQIHTGRGNGDRNDLYWGSGNYIWNNDGDTATLRAIFGKRVDQCRYPGGGSLANC